MSHTTRLSNHSEHNTVTRGLLLEHTTNEGNVFYKISSKYHTGLISDDRIQSQSVHMIIHYTTCGQICRLTLPDRGKNLYSQQNCIPALITTESCLTRSWFYKVALITSPWVFVYLVPALPWRYRMTGWLNWKLLSYHSASFAWASLHITEGIVCLREREREMTGYTKEIHSCYNTASYTWHGEKEDSK